MYTCALELGHSCTYFPLIYYSFSFWYLVFAYYLVASQVGYLSASIRSVADARVGDTITHYVRRAEDSLPGYEEATPMVFCGLFPVDADQYCSLGCFIFIYLHRWNFDISLMSLVLFNPMFFFGRFPELRDALEKLQLNDAALKVRMISNIMIFAS